MAITTKPPTVDDLDVVLAISDAPNNEAAIREIDEWAREKGFVRSNARSLTRPSLVLRNQFTPFT